MLTRSRIFRLPLAEMTDAVLFLALCLAFLMLLSATIAKAQQGSEGVMARLDFEQATIQPTQRQKNKQDILRVRMPANRTAEIVIQYEGGTHEDRFARIVPDPTNSGNHVLQYWLKHARIPGARKGYSKGRVQMNLAQINKPEIFARYRMYLHPDLQFYRSYPDENKWFSIGTMWIGSPTEPNAFMISLDLVKRKGAGQPLHFWVSGDVRVGGKRGQGKWETIWGKVNSDFEVPIGEWIEMQTGYKQGDGQTGRYYLGVRRQSDPAMRTIFDITDWTYNPDSRRPISLTNWNPFKLYTSEALIDHIRSNGGVAQILWDDLELTETWPR